MGFSQDNILKIVPADTTGVYYLLAFLLVLIGCYLLTSYFFAQAKLKILRNARNYIHNRKNDNGSEVEHKEELHYNFSEYF